jgi:hypothetical protein
MQYINLVLCCVCLCAIGRAAAQPKAGSTSALPWAAKLDNVSPVREQPAADIPLHSSPNAIEPAAAKDPDLLLQAAPLDVAAIAADLGLADSSDEHERSLDAAESGDISTADPAAEQQSIADQMASATADLNTIVNETLSAATTIAETNASDAAAPVVEEPVAAPGPRNIVDVLVDQGLMSAEEANTLTMRGHRGLLHAAPTAMAHAQLIDPTMVEPMVEPEVVVPAVAVPVVVPVVEQQNNTALADEHQGTACTSIVVTVC